MDSGSRAPIPAPSDYPDVARRAIREMYRQVGDLVIDGRGLVRRGLLLRHLVMPGMARESEAILRWIAAELGTGTYVNLMAQYRPHNLVAADRYPEIGRPPLRSEYEGVLELAGALGLLRIDPGSRTQMPLLPDDLPVQGSSHAGWGRPALYRPPRHP